MATLLVIQHVPHERLGTFEPAFAQAGCSLVFLNTYDPKATWPRLSQIDGLVVMGGPMSVYEQTRYPWISKELTLLQDALRRGLPILGVCLGAQFLAHALGAPVTKASQKEIGWYPVMREPRADGGRLFEAFGSTETVFQWHGDTFALPKGAVRLAASPLCTEQAFRYQDNVWGLQFHLEVTAAMIRAWMQTPANRAELASVKGVIDPMMIRRSAPQHLVRLGELSSHVAGTFARLVRSTRTGAVRARRQDHPHAKVA